jgi:hypothetical protein
MRTDDGVLGNLRPLHVGVAINDEDGSWQGHKELGYCCFHDAWNNTCYEQQFVVDKR